MIRIVRWKKPEPVLKLKIYRFIRPYAKLLDALISIVTLSQVISNFELEITEKSTEEWFKYLKSHRGTKKQMTEEQKIQSKLDELHKKFNTLQSQGASNSELNGVRRELNSAYEKLRNLVRDRYLPWNG